MMNTKQRADRDKMFMNAKDAPGHSPVGAATVAALRAALADLPGEWPVSFESQDSENGTEYMDVSIEVMAYEPKHRYQDADGKTRYRTDAPIHAVLLRGLW